MPISCIANGWFWLKPGIQFIVRYDSHSWLNIHQKVYIGINKPQVVY